MNTTLTRTIVSHVNRIFSVEICRLKWKTVRDSYIKYKKQLKNSDGSKEIDYIWSANLKFLDDHNVNRRSFYQTVGRRKVETEFQGRDEYEISYSPPLAPLGALAMAEVNSASFQNPDLRISEEHPIAKYKEIDATDLLFLSYSATFKKFPARQQTFMKLELAKLFANAELQQLDDAEQERAKVAATESLPVVIKREYPEEELDYSEGFSDDVTVDVNPSKRKRRET